jgi:SGNH hydrolase-like domain, acetyltransferase AlgX
MAAKIKIILLSFMLLLIAAPLLQDLLKVFHPPSLYGYYTLADDATFNVHRWLSGDYQEQKNKYLNDHVGFRPDLVRLNNQVDLSLFQNLHADAVLGKDRYLYQQCYIDEHYGRTFWGYDSIRDMCLKLKYIQDHLAAKGKTLLVIQPPTKDNFYPEYLPDAPGVSYTTLRNSIVYEHICDSLNINYIDVNAIFIKNKPVAKDPLFTKQGTHWSIYGSYITSDTIIKWLEHTRNVKLPELRITSVEHSEKARYTDNDLGWPLNLMIPFAKEHYAYPVATYISDSATQKPRLVLVGDSFNWSLITNGLIGNVFSNWQFWYYFKNVKNANNMEAPLDALSMNGYNWKGALDSTDCLLINYAPHNLSQMNDFVDSAYSYFTTRGSL